MFSHMESDSSYALYKACIEGNLFGAVNLINCGADVNATHGSLRETLLHVAIRSGCGRMVEVLLQAGINADIGDSTQVAPIHIASHTGQYKVVERLIKAGAQVDAQDESGKSALHFAVDRCQEDCLKVLLHYGASINLCDAKGFPPLYYATFRGTREIVGLLLTAGADVTQSYSVWSHFMASCPLQFSAATFNKDDILEAFASSGRINLDLISPVDKNTLLTAAIEGGRLNQMMILLENGASANAARLDLCTPLHVAVEKKSDYCVKTLLCAGANSNTRNSNGWSAFELAILGINKAVHSLIDPAELSIFKLLTSCGADLNDLNVFTRREAQMFLSKNPEVMYLLYEINSLFPKEILSDFPDSYSYNSNDHIQIVLERYNHPLCLQQIAVNVIRVRLQPFIFANMDKLSVPDSMKKFILLTSYM